MKATSLRVGVSLAVAGIVTPRVAFAQAEPPAGGATPPPAASAALPDAPVAAPAPAAETPVTPAPPVAAPAPEAAVTKAPEPPLAPFPEAAAAPIEGPPPAATISGFVETAWHIYLNHPSYNRPPTYRSFDSQNGDSFYLHAAHFAINHAFSDEASAVIELDAGSDATLVNAGYAPAGTPFDIQEAYGKWTPGKFTVTVGKFATYNGIEVIEGPLNPTITRGFLFGMAEPYTHVGAKVHYNIKDMAHIGAGVVNGWDTVLDNNTQKTLIFAADVVPVDTFHAQLSGSYGAEQPNNDKDHRLTVNLTGALVLHSLTLNFQALIGSEPNAPVVAGGVGPGAPAAPPLRNDDSWFGFGLQPVYTMDKFSLGARVEYFNNRHGSRLLAAGFAADDASLLNLTITPGFTPTKNFQFRAEYRLDTVLAAKDNVTGLDNKNLFRGSSSQSTVAIGATYMF